MEALVYTRPETVEVLDVDPPQPVDGEIELEIIAAGICGSELEGVRTPNSLRVPPLVMGHELVGRRLDNGDVVAINPLINCGECDLCKLGKTNLCRHRQLLGVHRPGGFAERIVIPESRARPVPAGLDPKRAVLAEPLANGLHALRLAERHLGRAPLAVGIIGAGMLGTASALAAVRTGIPRVAIADISPERLQIAASTLGIETTPRLRGELDVVIDAVGAASTRADAVDLLKPGGVSVWIGLHQPDAGFDSLSLVRQERIVCGTFAYLDAEFDEAVELCQEAHKGWVETVSLPDSAARFSELMREPGPVPKTVVVPKDRSRPVLEAISQALP